MKRLLIIWLMFLGLLTMASAQNYTAAQVKQKLKAVATSTKTMQCDFVQTKYVKMLNDKVVSRGKMYYARDNKLRWEYISPYQYTFVLNGQKVSMKNGKRSSTLDVKNNKMFTQITQIMVSTMVGQCVSDNRDFKVSLQGSGTQWKAVMTPLRSEMKKMFRSIVVGFNMKSCVVSSIEMVEKNGDKTIINIQDAKINTSISQSLFSVH